MITQRFFFAKTNRLSETRLFRWLFSRGKRHHTPSFCFHVLDNALSLARLGVVVAKKNQKLATRRNATKRLVRESFRYFQTHLSGFDFIVVAKRGIELKSKQELRLELETMWKRLANGYQSNCFNH